jgi:hypothetical protein
VQRLRKRVLEFDHGMLVRDEPRLSAAPDPGMLRGTPELSLLRDLDELSVL